MIPATSRLAGWTLAISAAVTAWTSDLRAQSTQWYRFADVRAVSSRRDSSATIAIGQLDFFVLSDLGRNFYFTSETAIEFVDSGFMADVERLNVSFAFTPRLQVVAGKLHNPIGYWSTAYHHGALIQPTIRRPTMFRFEHDGGVLPIHSTGILVSGRDLTPLHLGFDALVSSGIGSRPIQDNDRSKAITLNAHARVSQALLVGVSGYVDRMVAGVERPGGATLADDTRIRLGGAHVAYNGETVELRVEAQRMQSRSRLATRDANFMYAYVGFPASTVTPYARWDVLDIAGDDPWLGIPTRREVLVGLRYDPTPVVVLKAEYSVSHDHTRPPRTMEFQVAVGF